MLCALVAACGNGTKPPPEIKVVAAKASVMLPRLPRECKEAAVEWPKLPASATFADLVRAYETGKLGNRALNKRQRVCAVALKRLGFRMP